MKKLLLAVILASATSLFAAEQVTGLSDSRLNLENSHRELKEELMALCPNVGKCKKKRHKHEKNVVVIPEAYASFYTEETNNGPDTPFSDDETIVLNRIAHSTSNIILLPNGVIFIKKPGDYLVNFGASLAIPFLQAQAKKETLQPVFRIALTLNNEIQTGSIISSQFENQIFSGSTTIRVTNPSYLRLINAGQSATTSTLNASDITAFLTLHQLSEVPIEIPQ